MRVDVQWKRRCQTHWRDRENLTLVWRILRLHRTHGTPVSNDRVTAMFAWLLVPSPEGAFVRCEKFWTFEWVVALLSASYVT